MRVYIVFSSIMALASCGTVSHESSDGHKATSYQNIHIEHFHSVPTYVKKEHAHLLEHPIPKGQTSSEVKVHHGDKHDHGYASSNVHSDLGKGYEQEHPGSYEIEGHKYDASAASGQGSSEGQGHVLAYEAHGQIGDSYEGHSGGSSGHAGGSSSHIGGASSHIGGSSGQIGGSSSHIGGSFGHIGGSSSHIGGASSHIGGSSSHIGGSSDFAGGSSSHIGGSSSHIGGASSHIGGSSSHIGGSSDFAGGSSSHIGGSSGLAGGSSSHIGGSSGLAGGSSGHGVYEGGHGGVAGLYKLSSEQGHSGSHYVQGQGQSAEYDLSHYQGHEYQGGSEEHQGLGHYH